MHDFNGYVTLLDVTENFWRLSRTAKWLEILSQNFELTSSAKSRNHAENTMRASFKMTKVNGSQPLAK